MSEKNQDAKIAQLEARIARLEALLKVQPPPAEFYYKIPVRKIYKSYPVYAAGNDRQ